MRVLRKHVPVFRVLGIGGWCLAGGGGGASLSLAYLGTKQAYQLHWRYLENIIYQPTHDQTDSY